MVDEKGIAAGSFRTGAEPMQVVSGKFGGFEVYYEAQPSQDLPEMIGVSRRKVKKTGLRI